jgi:hypothetical protein
MGFLSRSGESHPFGKLTFELPKTKICEHAGEEITKRRQALGMSLAEYIRWVMTVHALGEEHARSVVIKRVEVVGRMGQGGYGDRHPGD